MAGRGWMLSILLMCSSLASAAERLALVIGNDQYAHFLSLSQAGGDARRVGDVLEALPQPFLVTRVADVNKITMNRALTAFQTQLSQRGGEVAFVYYAGHAVSYSNRVWLLPVDAQVEVPEDIEAAGMSLEDVAAKLRVGGWKAVVLVLDACRNQLYADGKAPRGIRGDALERGLGPIRDVEGLLLAYATASGQVAKEDTSTGGYYTSELLKHLRQPGLKLQDVFNDTALAVQRKTGQKPELNLTAIEPIFLAGQPAAEPMAAPDAERQLWDESHCNGSDRPGCEAYLAAYPLGRFAALARARMSGGAAHKPPPSPPRGNEGASTQPSRAKVVAGPRFRDCPTCPEMVVVPAGSFKQGSPYDESGRNEDEDWQRTVRVQAFALGVNEVSRGEFQRFVEATKYLTEAERNIDNEGCITYKGGVIEIGWKAGTSWRDVGFAQTDAHPVVCVSWNDAKAYIDWLNRQSGQRYRLPSESEFEYANRANTSTAWPWGSSGDAGCALANYADASARTRFPNWYATADCNDGQTFTAPVASYLVNAYGLFDTAGNVWEWAEDYWHDNYWRENSRGAPVDGGAWVSGGDSRRRVLRGGSWESYPSKLRSANRGSYSLSDRGFHVGFRVARSL